MSIGYAHNVIWTVPLLSSSSSDFKTKVIYYSFLKLNKGIETQVLEHPIRYMKPLPQEYGGCWKPLAHMLSSNETETRLFLLINIILMTRWKNPEIEICCKKEPLLCMSWSIWIWSTTTITTTRGRWHHRRSAKWLEKGCGIRQRK